MKAGLRVLYVAIGHIAPVLAWMMRTMKQHSPANFAKNSKGFAILHLARWGYPVLPYLEGKMGYPIPNGPLYNITQKHGEDAEAGTSGSVVIEIKDKFSGEPLELKSSKMSFSPDMLDAVSETPKKKKGCLTEIKKKNINSLSASIMKRKKEKQSNEDYKEEIRNIGAAKAARSLKVGKN
ncbi:hypothetical protein EVAR_10343_1 [Eumeta japonica]|uniref:Uncharacterized protein n=1 Tax=Eumeta variegata TaxID=151549 RepID=A0A4C1TDU6_EUMVA|nr:hypothetical protein EVAR_10343_1 [Eumeta japonica]